MAHKTKINGTAYGIKGGKTKVNGTGYSIKKGVTKVGGTGYNINFAPPIDATFANNDWSTIIYACQNNVVPSTWAVGNSKPMTINGTAYTIDIIGKSHDTYSSGGTAPLTFQFHDCYNTNYPMNSSQTNVGGYDSTAMHNTHLPSILNLMPTEVRNGIREVNKPTSSGNKSTTIETVKCKLFCLSEVEVFNSQTYSPSGEGKRYAYYNSSSRIQKYKNGSTYPWWERSPNKNNATYFACVNNMNSGEKGSAAANANWIGVAPAFCF